jgi:copper chaperone CopZ
VREELMKVDGVGDVEASPVTREARVVYKPARTNPEALARALNQASGAHHFTAEVKG